MPGHVAWKGHLRLSLVAVPVRAYVAVRSDRSPISLNQLHSVCHNRIRYKKACPVHGEVPANEIVMGYEYSKDEYVVIDPDELDELRTEADRSIGVSAFVPQDSIDPNYFSGRAHYLVPDGSVGERPYALLRQAMQEKEVCALAQVVLSSREQLVMVRSVGKLLIMNGLEYADQVKSPSEFEDDVPASAGNRAELRLTKTLIEALERPEPNLEEFKDVYYDKLKQLIDAKVSGDEIVTPPDAKPAPVVNFMDALKASVREVRKPAAPTKRGAVRKTAARQTSALREVKKKMTPRKRRKSG
jgi:DNA end-binding protein Ku